MLLVTRAEDRLQVNARQSHISATQQGETAIFDGVRVRVSHSQFRRDMIHDATYLANVAMRTSKGFDTSVCLSSSAFMTNSKPQ